MQEDKKLLEVGDVLFEHNRWHGLQRIVIDRVTPKRAFAAYNQFDREIYKRTYDNEFYVKTIGEYGTVLLSTPELELEFKTKEFINKARRMWEGFKFSNKITDIEEAQKVIDFIESFNTKTTHP